VFAFSATGSGSGSPAVTEVRTVVTIVAASPGASVRLSVCPGGGAPTWSRGRRCQGWVGAAGRQAGGQGAQTGGSSTGSLKAAAGGGGVGGAC
jgi:hypothetical protein